MKNADTAGWNIKPPSGVSYAIGNGYGSVIGKLDWDALIDAARLEQATDEDFDAALEFSEWLDALSPEEADEYKYWQSNPNRLRPFDLDEETPSIDWLVPGRFHQKGLAQVFAEPATGKTNYVIGLALSVATGKSHWLDYPLNIEGPQHVVYIAAEGGAPFRIMVHAWMMDHPASERPRVKEDIKKYFHVLDGGEGDLLELAWGNPERDGFMPNPDESFSRLLKELIAIRVVPAMVVYDTQVDLAPGINENSNSEMVQLLSDLKKGADRAGHLAVVVHHTPKGGTTARGAGGQLGKVDVSVRLEPASVPNTYKAKWSDAKVKGYNIKVEPDDVLEIVPVPDSEGGVTRRYFTTVQDALAVQQSLLAKLSPGDDVLDKVRQTIAASPGLSRAAIETTTGLSERQVKKALTYLQEPRVAEVKRTGSTRSTQYWLTVLDDQDV